MTTIETVHPTVLVSNRIPTTCGQSLMPSLPRSIAVFGFANTLLGSSGLVSGISALLRTRANVAQTVVYQQVNLPSQSVDWLHWAMILSPIHSALVLLCGIGLLRKKLWGRTLTIAYGYGAILFSLITSTINILRITDRTDNPMILNIILSILVSVFLGLAYKATMVYYLSRASVKTALANQPIGADILDFKSARQRHPLD
jgi:hypothetical protein